MRVHPDQAAEKAHTTKEQISKILERADSNGDGCYTRDELKKAFKDLGSYYPPWRTRLCLKEVDTNGDGQITGKEIDALIDYMCDRVYNGHYKIKN